MELSKQPNKIIYGIVTKAQVQIFPVAVTN